MIPGKLYKCPKYWLLFYPTEDKAWTATLTPDLAPLAAAASSVPRGTALETAAVAAWAREHAAWWSRKLSCTVRYSEPGEVFLCLENKDKLTHVLFGEKQGWIINKRWLEIEEAVNDPR